MFKGIKMFALAGLTALAASCMPISRRQYIEPRAGLVAPIAEETEEYNSSFMIGATYGISGRPYGTLRDRSGLEAGLDYFHSSAQYIETDSLLLGVNMTYPLISRRNPSIYLTGGLALLSEFSTIDIPEPFNVHDEKSDVNVGLSVGANIRFDVADIEDVSVGFSYISMPGSENVKGMFVLTGGYRF